MKIDYPSYIIRLLGGAAVCSFSPLFAAQPSSTPPMLSGSPDGVMERAASFSAGAHPQAAADQLRLLSVPPAPWIPADDARDILFLEGQALYGEGNPECIDVLERFIALYPDSPRALEARLMQADWYFFAGQYPRAVIAYSDINPDLLAGDSRDTYTYRRMLSMMKCGLDREALPLIAQLAARGGKWRLPALYYQAYADYRADNYDAAYAGFKEVAEAMADSPADGRGSSDVTPSASRRGRRPVAVRNSARPVTPFVSDGMEPLYYMVQIEYTRGQYREVIDHGRTLLDKRRVAELLPELRRVMGLSYFKLGDYASARGLLEDYVENPDLTPGSDAVYALGAIEYAAGDYAQAAERFSSLTDLRNDLAQGAYLYLGQCAARQGDENAAAMAFEKASRMNYDSAVGETALYNYIAAQTRGGKIPFSSSIALYEQFLDEYPASRFAPAVRESLASAYYNEQDYARALESIDRISRPSASVCLARQRILYQLGIRQLGRGESRQAAVSLQGAVDQKGGDPAVAAQAALWLGDALYDTGAYAAADKAYESALQGGVKGENAALATYDRAYALYMQDKFAEAARLFRISMTDSHLSASQRADARVRLADCLYYAGDYAGAAASYGDALDSGEGDADYAAWRLALLRGVQGDNEGKIQQLNDFMRSRRDSRWAPGVLLELGRTYIQIGNREKGISSWERLVKEYTASPEARPGSLLLARAYMDAGRDSAAEAAYKRILTSWPSGQEADEAHQALKRHYAGLGRLEEYAGWLASIPGGRSVEADEMDSLTFEAAESAYVEQDSDTSLLRKYLETYPSGHYRPQALLYIMRAEVESGRYDEALTLSEEIIAPDSGAPEALEALMTRAEILETHYPARRPEALEAWRRLERAGGAALAPEAWSGIMRTTDNPSERMDYARKVSRTGGITATQAEQARLFEALGMLEAGQTQEAVSTLAGMARNPATESGARAAVELGNHYLSAGQPAKAIELLSDFTDTGSPHSYWLARGFISLADAYKATGQKYLAVEYLKSLRDNYPGDEPEIHDAISSRLKKWK